MEFLLLLRNCAFEARLLLWVIVSPKDVQGERDAWAEHFRLIGEGDGFG